MTTCKSFTSQTLMTERTMKLAIWYTDREEIYEISESVYNALKELSTESIKEVVKQLWFKPVSILPIKNTIDDE